MVIELGAQIWRKGSRENSTEKNSTLERDGQDTFHTKKMSAVLSLQKQGGEGASSSYTQPPKGHLAEPKRCQPHHPKALPVRAGAWLSQEVLVHGACGAARPATQTGI